MYKAMKQLVENKVFPQDKLKCIACPEVNSFCLKKSILKMCSSYLFDFIWFGFRLSMDHLRKTYNTLLTMAVSVWLERDLFWMAKTLPGSIQCQAQISFG
jgi:hypothetical protein